MFEGLKILYLEDEPLVSFDTAEHLESLGFDRVEAAQRLANAEALARDEDFDLAVLDINVDRGQTSLELGRTLANAGTVVIFASGTGSEAKSLCEKGFDFLDKPFSLTMLTERLKAAAERHKSA